MIHLQKVEVDGKGGYSAKYAVMHTQPGREGTVLVLPLQIDYSNGKASCSLTVVDCTGSNPDAALERLAVWCERTALAIRERAENPESIRFK
jgi:hypothetical protein